MASFSDLIKSADAAIRSGDLDTAEQVLDRVNRALAKTNHFHFYGSNNTVDDDEEDFESPSDPSNDDPDDDSDDDDDDFDKRMIRKASDLHPVMGGAKPLPEPQAFGSSGGHRADPYKLGSEPATRPARAHKFDRLVEQVQDRDQCSKNEAMATARREYPDVYTSYQGFVASSPTSEQHTRRAGRGVGKSMPDSYEDLVSAEMRKGVPWRIAEQRVINTHGSTAFNNRNRIIKSAVPSIDEEFTRHANEIMDATGCERTEALRALRLEKRYLYDALNSV